MIKSNKINNIEIEVIKKKQRDINALGKEYFKTLFSNIWICAKKKSGKSTLIYNIVKHCAGAKTNVMIISPTVDKDDVYIELVKYLNKKKINVFKSSSLTVDKFNVLADLMDMLKNEKKENENYPKYIIILDDLSKQLRNKHVEEILKVNRHHQAKVIISSQYCKDLMPASIQQIDYALLLNSFNFDKMTRIHELLDLAIDSNKLYSLYKHATSEKYNFLYIDVRNEEYRKNFNTKLIVA